MDETASTHLSAAVAFPQMASRRSMPPGSRPSTSAPTPSHHGRPATSASRPKTGLSTTTAGARTRAGASTIGPARDQHIVCALTESRGISPTVGMAFINLTTAEAVLCQISDNQTYVKTLHKLHVFDPSEILFPQATNALQKSKLQQILETSLDTGSPVFAVARKYWDKTEGLQCVENYAFEEDVQAIKVSIGGNFYASCCFAAVSALLLSFSCLCVTAQGSILCRAHHAHLLCNSLHEDQVRAFGRIDDDRCVNRSCPGVDRERPKLELQGQSLWPSQHDGHQNGREAAAEYHTPAARRTPCYREAP